VRTVATARSTLLRARVRLSAGSQQLGDAVLAPFSPPATRTPEADLALLRRWDCAPG
jgi:hypothetical protein